ncbi:spermine/spermidine synthase domain-containing protein [Pontiella desulfatans]|nr:spermidine synthase [Pontiella desulfatans]
MSIFYEELDFRPTPIGDLMLRRRRMPQFGDTDIYEVKLAEDFLMTSLFHEAESQLAIKGLAALDRGDLDVVVGGLGLGYTAVEALKDARVASLVVVDFLEAVIGWHQSELVPLGKTLNDDLRCSLRQADFFALMRNAPEKQLDAILLDIDHTPTNVLHQSNTHFYTEEGLAEMAQHLKPDGVFAMWADGAPEDFFAERLGLVFAETKAHTIEFNNPITGGTSVGAVYVAAGRR